LDGLNAGWRNVITTDDAINDNHEVFEDFKDNYNSDPNDGIKAAFDDVTSKDDHYLTDRYTISDPSVKFFLN
jgi:hypothetical protein